MDLLCTAVLRVLLVLLEVPGARELALGVLGAREHALGVPGVRELALTGPQGLSGVRELALTGPQGLPGGVPFAGEVAFVEGAMQLG